MYVHPALSKSQEAQRPHFDWKKCYLHLFFNPKSSLWGFAPTLSAWLQWRFHLIKKWKYVFSNQFGILWLPATWIMPEKLYGAILCLYFFFWVVIFIILKRSQLHQLCRRKLQHSFAVKCFVDDKTSPNFPLIWGWLDWIFILDELLTKNLG